MVGGAVLGLSICYSRAANETSFSIATTRLVMSSMRPWECAVYEHLSMFTDK